MSWRSPACRSTRYFRPLNRSNNPMRLDYPIRASGIPEGSPIKEERMYIGIGALLVIILLVILLA